jgi:hypothetical protein
MRELRIARKTEILDVMSYESKSLSASVAGHDSRVSFSDYCIDHPVTLPVERRPLFDPPLGRADFDWVGSFMKLAGRKKPFNERCRFSHLFSEVYKPMVDFNVPLFGSLWAPSATRNAAFAIFDQPSLALRKFIQNRTPDDKYDIIGADQLFEGAEKRSSSRVFRQVQPDTGVDKHPDRGTLRLPLAHRRSALPSAN